MKDPHEIGLVGRLLLFKDNCDKIILIIDTRRQKHHHYYHEKFSNESLWCEFNIFTLPYFFYIMYFLSEYVVKKYIIFFCD